jgi:eight-cysteine-cluster-containing protein
MELNPESKQDKSQPHIDLDRLIHEAEKKIKKHKLKKPVFATLIILITLCIASRVLIIVKNNQIQTQKPAPTLTPIPTSLPKSTTNDCIIGGCNNEICAEEEMFSICVYKKEYECFKTAICERQPDGSCGWTQTSQYKDCLDKLTANL